MARKVTEPSFEFWYDEKYYTVQGAKTIMEIGTKDDIATMRAEYTRMRDVAQKRLKRLGKAFPESKTYQEHRKGFAKLRDIDPRDLPKAFSELAKFVRAKSSTVTGQRQMKEKTMKTWQEQGLDLNPKNYDKVIKVLEGMRKQKITYGSDKAVSVADIMLDFDDQQTREWLDNLDYLLSHEKEVSQLAEELGGLEGYSFDEIIEMLGE